MWSTVTTQEIREAIRKWYLRNGQSCPPLRCWNRASLIDIHNDLYHRDIHER